MTQSEQKATRIVKKYGNRKLYDTETSKYITLPTLISFIVGGEDVMVVDKETQTDVTRQTLLKALVETETEIEAVVLKDIFKAGGLKEYLKGRSKIGTGEEFYVTLQKRS